MFCQVPKLLLTVLLAVSFSFAHANEAKEEKKEGEGGKEEKKEAKSAEDSYAVVQARVQTLEAKVHSSQEELEKLIKEKQETKDPAKVSEVIKQMLSIHKELEKNVKEYDQQRALLKYRYPEKGLAEKREYERIDVKSIEDMETQMSLTNSVKRTLQKVRTQYESASDAKARELKASKLHKSNDKSSEKSSPSLTEPVVLKK